MLSLHEVYISHRPRVQDYILRARRASKRFTVGYMRTSALYQNIACVAGNLPVYTIYLSHGVSFTSIQNVQEASVRYEPISHTSTHIAR